MLSQCDNMLDGDGSHHPNNISISFVLQFDGFFALLRVVFPSRTNFLSFHYFLLKSFVETILDELSAKIHFSEAQEARKIFFFPQIT